MYLNVSHENGASTHICLCVYTLRVFAEVWFELASHCTAMTDHSERTRLSGNLALGLYEWLAAIWLKLTGIN